MMLIVEDNNLFCAMLREALSLRHPALMVEVATTIALALQKLRESPPDLALLDIGLPDGSGLDLAATILASRPDLPIAICTNYDIPEYREVAKRIGVSSYLIKQDLDWSEFSRFISGRSHLHERNSAPGAPA